MKVKIKLTNDKAKVPFKKYDSDFCYDCVATSEEEIAPNVWKYGLGVAFQIERGWEALLATDKYKNAENKDDECFQVNVENSPFKLSIDARPRSSVWKTGMVLSNCEGTIDEGFNGEVSAVFYHVMPSMPRYKVGDRVCQIKLGFTLPMEFEVVESLEKTDRNDGGFGSTGK